MDDLLYFFIKIIWATHKYIMSSEVDADVFFPMSLLRGGEVGTRKNAHRLSIKWYDMDLVLLK